MRYTIRVPRSLVIRADVPQLVLAVDSLFGRIRDLGLMNSWMLVGLARLASQLLYRIASERWRVENEEYVFQLELAEWEADALIRYKREIIFELKRKIEEYRAILESGRARNKYVIESRIAALEVLIAVLEQIDRKNKAKKPLLREEGW